MDWLCRESWWTAYTGGSCWTDFAGRSRLADWGKGLGTDCNLYRGMVVS